MPLNTSRPTVLITGASSGIGSELVPFFAGTEHNVVLVAQQKPILEGIAAAVRHVFHVDATVIACDLTLPGAAHEIMTELSRRMIDIDVLVNNAGFGAYGEFAEAEYATEERIIQANIVALTVLTDLLLPGMVARGGGKILNVASAAGFAPIPIHSVSSAARAYVLRFSESLDEELKGTGVTVTSLCPDPTESNSKTSTGPMIQAEEFSARAMARTGFRALIRGDRAAAPGWRGFAITPGIA